MIGYIILALFVAFIAVLLIRAAAFKPKPEPAVDPQPVSFDNEAAIDALGQLVRCATVSYYDPEDEDDAEFEKLIGLIPVLYPRVYETCTLTRFDGRGLLFKWKGKGDGDPAVLMAHYDVVPVDLSGWEKPPFEAIIEDGVMWGRGTLDTKVTFNGILSAAENLIAQGFVPADDIYFAFSGCEETNGPGAKNIMYWFRDNNINPSFVLDEGGGVVTDVFPGVKQPCGLIGTAEKGLLNETFKVASKGGHASAPKPHTPVGELALACAAVEAHPFKCRFSKPVLELFDTLGRHSNFLYRIIFANLWCFKGVLDLITKKSGGTLNALIRTTCAFTMMSGSNVANVIPSVATMTANIRVNPLDTIESTEAYLKKVIGNDDVIQGRRNFMTPSPISRTDCEGWNRVKTAVAETWGCIVSPYLMIQCSDSRYYGEISDKVYRFSAMDFTAEEQTLLHGNNERIRLEVIGRAVEFFMRVMKQC